MRKGVTIVLVVGLISGVTSSAGAVRTGQQVYETVCNACHATGLSDAQKFGDTK
jgi:cytochrome c5